jgi:hypothetical protein
LREEPKAAGQIAEGLPRELERIIARCLRKSPERRFQTMADLKVALEELKEESDSGTLGAAQASVRRRDRRLGWAAALVVVTAGGAGALWFFRSPQGDGNTAGRCAAHHVPRLSNTAQSFSRRPPGGFRLEWRKAGQLRHLP